MIVYNDSQNEQMIYVNQYYLGNKNRYEAMEWSALVVVIIILVITIGGFIRQKLYKHSEVWKKQHLLLNCDNEQ